MNVKKTDFQPITRGLFNLEDAYYIKSSESYISYCISQINYYKNELRKLQAKKPFNFQKKKLQAYNTKIEELENKLYELNGRLFEELQFFDTEYNSFINSTTKLNEKKKIA